MGEPTDRDSGTLGPGATDPQARVARRQDGVRPDTPGATRADERGPNRESGTGIEAGEAPTGMVTFGTPNPAGTAEPVPPQRVVPSIPGYEILGELGRGAMGVVYHARQVRLNRPCALKMVLAGAHADAAAAIRFLAEAEAVARLQHPHVV
jgi:serine/threonine protein kinase